jgi:hypothetical protein
VHIDGLDWRTSTFSGDNGASCVEVAFLPDGGTALRDTKNRALAAHHYPATTWTAFLAAVRNGEFAGR